MSDGFFETLKALPAAYEDDAALKHKARSANFRCRLVTENGDYLIAMNQGALDDVVRAAGPMVPSDFAFHADKDAWATHWQPVPPPEYHDIFAMTRAGHLTILGDFKPLMTHLQVVKDVLALPRRQG